MGTEKDNLTILKLLKDMAEATKKATAHERAMATQAPLAAFVDMIMSNALGLHARCLVLTATTREDAESNGIEGAYMASLLDPKEMLALISAAQTALVGQVARDYPEAIKTVVHDAGGGMRAVSLDELPADVREALGFGPRHTND